MTSPSPPTGLIRELFRAAIEEAKRGEVESSAGGEGGFEVEHRCAWAETVYGCPHLSDEQDWQAVQAIAGGDSGSLWETDYYETA